MTRQDYLKLCNEFKDDSTQELFVIGSRDITSYCDDPLLLSRNEWEEYDYILKPRKRKLGQWIFDQFPRAHYITKTQDGNWFEYRVEIVTEHGTHFERHGFILPEGVEEIDWKDSLIFNKVII